MDITADNLIRKIKTYDVKKSVGIRKTDKGYQVLLTAKLLKKLHDEYKKGMCYFISEDEVHEIDKKDLGEISG